MIRASLTYPYVFDLVGNTVCAGLLDYVQHDHLIDGERL